MALRPLIPEQEVMRRDDPVSSPYEVEFMRLVPLLRRGALKDTGSLLALRAEENPPLAGHRGLQCRGRCMLCTLRKVYVLFDERVG